VCGGWALAILQLVLLPLEEISAQVASHYVCVVDCRGRFGYQKKRTGRCMFNSPTKINSLQGLIEDPPEGNRKEKHEQILCTSKIRGVAFIVLRPGFAEVFDRQV
jgi:hypothetical protein